MLMVKKSVTELTFPPCVTRRCDVTDVWHNLNKFKQFSQHENGVFINNAVEMDRLQLTFAMLKPHVIKNPIVVNCIRKEILKCNFKLVKCKRHAFTPKEAESFYGEHKGKFFYQRLVTSMTSGPTDLMVMAREDSIAKWREIMGPTKVFKAQYEAPHTLRAKYGLSDTRNATHGADSPESVKREVSIVFPEFCIEQWYEECEPYFRKGEVKFDEENFIHKCLGDKCLNNASNKSETR